MDGIPTHLHDRWNALCPRVGAFASAQEADMSFDMLVHLYTHPPRHYHNLEHVAQVLSVFDEVRGLASDRLCVEFALWLHDCVYVAERPDNEDRSTDAAVMVAGLLGAPREFVESVRIGIAVTRHSKYPPPTGDPALIADLDLSILAADEPTYDAYRLAIRREFGFADDPTFIQGRIAFIHRILDRESIFATRLFRKEREPVARSNLERELELLEHGRLH
jgi:predicted metal-dependent HD superfamily phosphohydrolase